MKKLSLMVAVALLAWQTTVVAQTTPTKTKTTTKKSKKTTQAGNNLNGQQYSTSDRSGLNSYQSATDTPALGSGTGDTTASKAAKAKKNSKKSMHKSKP